MTIGSTAMFTATPDTPVANIYGYSIILGAGTGLVSNLGFTVSGVTIMTKTSNALDLQRVTSMQNLSLLGFQTISLLVGGQVFQTLSMKNLAQVLKDPQRLVFASEPRIAARSHRGYRKCRESGVRS